MPGIVQRLRMPRGVDLRKDFFASIVVVLVALPLCMGIALGVGAPMSAGLISGIIGGIVVGLLGGAALQVSGPAAGLIVIVAEVVRSYGSTSDGFDLQRGMTALGAAMVVAGAIQIAAGYLRLGQWFRAVSPAVIEGMLTGIGVLIVATQFHLMVDDPTKRAHGLDYLLSIPQAVEKGLFPFDDSQHHRAARIGVLTILVMMVWAKLPWRRLRMLPAPLVAVLAAAIAANGLNYNIDFVRFQGGLLEGLRLLHPGDVASLFDTSLILTGFAIAFIASAETLLCATAVDGMHSGPRTRYDRELAAQGVGNALCGLVGGLPITGVIVRSAANVQAGATSRASATMHGAWLLLLVTLFPHLLEFVPKAALAAVLVYTGFKLMSPKILVKLWSQGRAEAAIFLITVSVIVVEDLLTGVIAGIALSAIRILWQVTKVNVRMSEDPATGQISLSILGNATFLRLPRLADALDKVPPGRRVVVNVRHIGYVDHAVFNLLETWAQQYESNGGSVQLDRKRLAEKLGNADSATNRTRNAGGSRDSSRPELARRRAITPI